MGLHVFENDGLQLPVLSVAAEERVQDQALDHWKDEDGDEGQTKNHQDEHTVQNGEEQLKVVVDVSSWSHIVGEDSQHNQHDGHYKLRDREPVVFKLCNLD